MEDHYHITVKPNLKVHVCRFLNTHPWSTRKLIDHVREQAIEQINSHCPLGRKAFLQVIIDLTNERKMW